MEDNNLIWNGLDYFFLRLFNDALIWQVLENSETGSQRFKGKHQLQRLNFFSDLEKKEFKRYVYFQKIFDWKFSVRLFVLNIKYLHNCFNKITTKIYILKQFFSINRLSKPMIANNAPNDALF